MGADPTSSAWKADVLAGKLYLHISPAITGLPEGWKGLNSTSLASVY